MVTIRVSYGLNFGLWTRSLVAELIERKFAIPLGATAGSALTSVTACDANRRRASSSHSKVVKKLSHMALSYASPTDPMDCLMPASRQRPPKARAVYWLLLVMAALVAV